MPRSLGSRLALTLGVTTLAVVLAVGAALFVSLRDLHREAGIARLHAVGTTVLTQVGARVDRGEAPAILETIQGQLAGLEINVAFIAIGGRVVTLSGDPPPVDAVPAVPATGRGTFGDATVAFGDGRRWLVTTMALGPVGAPEGRGLMLATPDRSGADTLADLLHTVPFVILVALLVGGALGWLLVRSTVRPLRRLATATGAVPEAQPGGGSGGTRAPIPPAGPAEVRHLTERFNAMTAALDASQQAETELLANLRHDLRTPLTVIGGFAEALVDGTAHGEDATRAAQTIADETGRLERLVDELGAAAEHGGGELRLEELLPGPILDTAAGRHAARAARAGVALEVDAAGAPGFAADRLAVERIVDNLVENALRALEPARGGRVVLGAHPGSLPDGRLAVVLAVSDDGPGFPAGALERVFERTFRGDPARSGPGSGLGLSIVREQARAHGGDAIAENLAPRGARVSVVLPLVPATLA
jgi:signal transduction histidine kinase